MTSRVAVDIHVATMTTSVSIGDCDGTEIIGSILRISKRRARFWVGLSAFF